MGVRVSAGQALLWLASLVGLLAIFPIATTAAKQTADEMSRKPLDMWTWKPDFLQSEFHHRYFSFDGDTVIRNDKEIRLTTHESSQSGYISSRRAVTVDDWQMTIDFKIHGSNTLYGDGMAVWFSDKIAEQGPVFGINTNFRGLGILVDTYKNNRPGTVFPYVMAMKVDPNEPYDKDHDGKTNELAGCSVRGMRNNDASMRITNIRGEHLTVDMKYKGRSDWEHCFTLTDDYVPRVPFLAISAATGQLVDNHEVTAIETFQLHKGSGHGDFKQTPGKPGWKTQSKSSGWGKLLLLVVVAVVAYFGFTAYRAQAPRPKRSGF